MLNVHRLGFSCLGSFSLLDGLLKRDCSVFCRSFLCLYFLGRFLCCGFFCRFRLGAFLLRFFGNRLLCRNFLSLCFLFGCHLFDNCLGQFIDELKLSGILTENLLLELCNLLLHGLKSGKLLDHVASRINGCFLRLLNSLLSDFLGLLSSLGNNCISLILCI